MKKFHILISTGKGSGENYEKTVRLAGGEAFSRYCPAPDTPCDALILGGGGDIAPELLGEEDKGSRDIDRDRDLAELLLAKEFAAMGKPILGICRGHQVLNVALGGSLIQDVGFSLERFHSPEPYGKEQDLFHGMYAKRGSQIEEMFGTFSMVNSWHHQAIQTAGKGLCATGWSESGLVEACEHEALPIITVQFHPERLFCMETLHLGDGGALFRWLLRQCDD